jgi:hypothetical protein
MSGALAGAAGTLAMDLVWFARYKRGGGESIFLDWEPAKGLNSWDNASAPARVGKLLYETFIHTELPGSRAALTTNVMHWGYGLQWGILLALTMKNRDHLEWWHAPLFGSLVWLASYVSLPVAGFYKPIWQYDVKTLWDDWSAHLVYGAAAVTTFWLTAPRPAASRPARLKQLVV